MTKSVKDKPDLLYSIPNLLTYARIVAVPIVVLCFFIEGKLQSSDTARWWALGIFVTASLTDFLDGYLARIWQQTSNIGRMLDPIADKLLVAGCLIAFMIAAQGAWVFMVPALAIIGRDILVSGAREHAALAGRVMPPTNLAKWKTACEMLAIAALLVWVLGKAYLAIDTVIPSIAGGAKTIGLVLLWLAATLSVYTGSLYFRAALKA